MLLSHYKSILSQYEAKLAKHGTCTFCTGESNQGRQKGGGGVQHSSRAALDELLRDLRAMFADGRRLLELGQQVQVRSQFVSYHWPLKSLQ
jgi:hypothetical protein